MLQVGKTRLNVNFKAHVPPSIFSLEEEPRKYLYCKEFGLTAVSAHCPGFQSAHDPRVGCFYYRTFLSLYQLFWNKTAVFRIPTLVIVILTMRW